ncbi:uncharacterized protein LOC8031777 [Ixodes scapularis]|uniref:uncharacterized protein LOC8031777 n=1 Tax=Ixodes scapularis TaxID=6945 RepID=UPI001A9F0FA5|nr:uncharacterized protein LOC8031777 [Ixodes scapularis]
MMALALTGALWAAAVFVPVHCVHLVRVEKGHVADYSTESSEAVEVKINKDANNFPVDGVTSDNNDLEDREAYVLRRLLEKFVYALNLKTIITTLRQTVSGEITPGRVIAKIKELVGETSTVAVGLIQVIKNMGTLAFKVFVNRISGGESSFYSAEDFVRDLPLFKFSGKSA